VFSLLLALFFAVLALWLALFQAGRWERRNQVSSRFSHARVARVDDVEQTAAVPQGLSARLTASPFFREDYREVYNALKLTGKEAEKIQAIYLLFCWALPAVLLIIGGFTLGVWIGVLLAIAGFLGSRHYVRTSAKRTCQQQNREAIEFAQLLALLLEAGLSVERAFRIAAIQARPMIPSLIYRLERFNRLMESGADRGVALDEIGEGKAIPVLYGLTRLLKQSGALGGAVSESIEQLIAEAQDVERSKIKEEVNRVGAKMTVVMMVFMMPALFIIIGGPAGMNIVQALSR